MSLKQFVKNKDVREKFTQEFPKPEFGIKRELLAPPLSPLYFIVGTAFHYLMGFYVRYLNPRAAPEGWVAEVLLSDLNTFEVIKSGGKLDSWKGIKEPNLQSYPEFLALGPKGVTDLHNKVRNIISEAKQNHSIFLQNGIITDNLIRSASLLAPLDDYYRSPRRESVYKHIGLVDEKILEDLKRMIFLVDKKSFLAKKICILSPTFGQGLLFGGGDADLIIDDMLIEIKTDKELELPRDYFHQLIGYYALYKIGGIDSLPKEHDIKRFGIYFSRYGYLHVININDIINDKTFPSFLKWFIEKAKEKYSYIKWPTLQ